MKGCQKTWKSATKTKNSLNLFGALYMTKRGLIRGFTGQDESYLAEFLLEKGYEVYGVKRRASLFNTQRLDHIYEDPRQSHTTFNPHYGNLSDSSNLTRILQDLNLDEVFNMGAQSHVAVSFGAPEGIDLARFTHARAWRHARAWVDERLMRDIGIEGVRRGKKIKTSWPDKALPCPMDRVNRQFRATMPNQLWVSDFTYVSTWQGFVYVAFVIDAFVNKIISWRASRSATLYVRRV